MKTPLEQLLQKIGQSLDLPPHISDQVAVHYKTVQKWICEGDYFKKFDILVYPQGSYALGTVNKPMLDGEEFDLDFILEITDTQLGDPPTPSELRSQLLKRLRENANYAPKLHPKNRCAQIQFSGQFHMDVIPARCRNQSSIDSRILIPDHSLQDWTYSNPKGYIEWFEAQCNKTVERVQFDEHVTLSGEVEVEPLPAHETNDHKKPLQQAVRIMKHHRDLFFAENPEKKPISIILTTLAGKYYSGENTVHGAIKQILSSIYSNLLSQTEIPTITNPSDKDENFAEKWIQTPVLYSVFKAYIREFIVFWDQLENQLTDSNLRSLKEKLGEDIVHREYNQLDGSNSHRAKESSPIPVITNNAQPKPWKEAISM
ncbi:MAG: nucleotidyltransferase [Leptospiraceae bacterium]|nr:nucleotidyltransferase [Leptospiraceae bacterium]